MAPSQAANCVPAGVVGMVSVDMVVEGNDNVKWGMTELCNKALIDIRMKEERTLALIDV
jgi:hypothetical protein